MTIPVRGAQRYALVNVPPSSDGTQPLPLVLVYHGASSTGVATEDHLRFSELANRYGFIAVYPTSNGDYWNYTGHGYHAEDDVDFTNALLDNLEQQLCVDPQRVYATGGSNGAAFVAMLACQMSNRLAGIALVAGVYGVQPPCQPARPVPVLEIHGTLDGYNGRNGQGSVKSFLAQWMALDGCPPGPPVTRRFARSTVVLDKYGCAAGTIVAHVKLIGGIHAWPGGADVTNAPAVDYAVSASLAALQFFQCAPTANPAGPSCPPPQFARSSRKRRRR